jgi:serine/threonine protein phosphatase PrpC
MKTQDIVYGISNVGRIRTNNEDNFIAQRIWDDSHVLAVAIDGVGGQEGGEIAAEIAKNTIRDYLINNPNGEEARLLKEAVNDANNAIYNERQKYPGYSSMSCVLTACIIDDAKGTLNWCHVGDTRLYVFENGLLKKLSHDHSLVGYREEIGELTEEEAMNHPQRNIINRDVGSAMHRPDDDDFIESGSYESEDKLIVLLCSDGLSDMLTSAQITACINEGKTLKQKCERLIAEANNKGGEDNITVILAKIPQRKKQQEIVSEPETEQQDEVIDDPAMDTLNIPYVIESAREKPAKKRPSRYRSLSLLIPLIAVSFLFWLFFKQQASPTLTNGNDTIRNAPVAVAINDSLYLALQQAQSNGTDTFNFPVKNGGNFIQISMPLVIYADSFHWIQDKTLFVEPVDSLKTPVGLIISGKNFTMKNVVFRKFTADTLSIRKKERTGNSQLNNPR